MKKAVYFLIICFLGILLNACAFDLFHIEQIPTQIKSTNLSKPSFELEKEVNFVLDKGFTRKLKQGTKWNYVGTVSYGDVFRSKDQILTVEASNIHEAYIVVSGGKLVGFYLPVERSYSPLGDSQILYMKEINQ